jgi:negative regulator of flagellin synthesis FlgM
MSYTTGLTPNGLPLAGDTSATESIASTARTQGIGQSSASEAAAAIASDSAKVSLAGTMLSEATTGSDVRFDKVAALRESIDGGTYNVSASDVAGKIVDSLIK